MNNKYNIIYNENANVLKYRFLALTFHEML